MTSRSTVADETGAPVISELVDGWLTKLAPEVRGTMNTFHREAWAALDPVLLELARLRIAMMLGDSEELARRTPAAAEAGLSEAKIGDLAQWPDSPHYSPRERACIALTEQYVGDVASLTKADVDAVLEHLSPAEVYGFVNALLAFDEHQRLRLALQRVFEPEEATR